MKAAIALTAGSSVSVAPEQGVGERERPVHPADEQVRGERRDDRARGAGRGADDRRLHPRVAEQDARRKPPASALARTTSSRSSARHDGRPRAAGFAGVGGPAG